MKSKFLTNTQSGLIINALNLYVENCPYHLRDEVLALVELLDHELHADYHGLMISDPTEKSD